MKNLERRVARLETEQGLQGKDISDVDCACRIVDAWHVVRNYPSRATDEDRALAARTTNAEWQEAWTSQLEADAKARRAAEQARRDEKARAEAEAARVRLTPLEDRLTPRCAADRAATVIRANSAQRCVGLGLSADGTGAALTASGRFGARSGNAAGGGWCRQPSQSLAPPSVRVD